MASRVQSKLLGAVEMKMKADPYPWPALSRPCNYSVNVENNWPHPIHNVEMYVRPLSRNIEIRPKSTIAIPIVPMVRSTYRVYELSTKVQSVALQEDVHTVVSFFDSMQLNGAGFIGDKHTLQSTFELETR